MPFRDGVLKSLAVKGIILRIRIRLGFLNKKRDESLPLFVIYTGIHRGIGVLVASAAAPILTLITNVSSVK